MTDTNTKAGCRMPGCGIVLLFLALLGLAAMLGYYPEVG